jgi:hypothetical protein
LAYLNHAKYQGDNGRVLGFDNAHDYHHRHFMGVVESVEYVSYESTLEQYQNEWQALISRRRLKK